MNQIKVGLLGIAGAGKDTIASYLTTKLKDLSIPSTDYRFATSLKIAAESIFGSDFDQREVKEQPKEVLIKSYQLAQAFGIGGTLLSTSLYAELINKDIRVTRTEAGMYVIISPTEFQQIMGTEVLRKIDNDYHVNRLSAETAKLLYPVILIPDVRFSNELHVCDLLIYIHTNKKSLRKDHISEKLANNLQELANEYGAVSQYLKEILWYEGMISTIDNKQDEDGKYLQSQNSFCINLLAGTIQNLLMAKNKAYWKNL